MVEVIKKMLTSFKRSQACTATLKAPTADPSPWETPGLSRASLGQSLVGYCSFLLGPGVHSILFLPSKSLFPQFSVSSGNSMVG